MPTYLYNPVRASTKTTSPGHGHIQPQEVGLSQRTNSHQYDPERDVVGIINDQKPQHYTTIYVTTNFKTSEDMLPGQWIVLTCMLSTRDMFGLPPRKFWAKDVAIGNDIPGRDVAWSTVTFKFTGFPTQAQFVQLYIIRRAHLLGGDFGSVIPTQSLYVCSNIVTYGGYSDAAPVWDAGYGFGYGANYGNQL